MSASMVTCNYQEHSERDNSPGGSAGRNALAALTDEGRDRGRMSQDQATGKSRAREDNSERYNLRQFQRK